MKTIVSTNTVVNSPNLAPKGFTLKQKNLAKIINIVENDIYSDKILAVIREYSCNAYDANVEAGKRDVPIVVSLPSRLSPEFKVRDNGNGLTEDEIHEVFTSYGESTKENSDDYIGQLGIGSKSGFAYGDNFVVTSWKNGIKTVYNAVKGSDVRDMVKLYSEPSTEASGIEISIPVKTGDEAAFKSKSINFFKYWQTVPKVIGLQDNEVSKINDDVVIDGGDWKIYSSDGYHSGKAVALMGNISYPIQWELVVETLRKQNKLDSRTNGIISFITRNTTLLRFQIGEVQMAPSREALQYTEHTVNNIIKKVDKICNEIERIIIDKISSAKTLWQFKCNITEVFGRTGTGYGYTSAEDKYRSLNSLDHIFALVKTKLMFNGKNVTDPTYDGFNQWDAVRGFVQQNDPRYSLPNNQFLFTPCISVFRSTHSDKLSGEGCSRSNNYFKVTAHSNNHIMIMDVDRKSYVKQAIKWYINTNKVGSLYVLNFKNDAAKKAFDVAYDFAGATIVKFSDVFAKYKPLIPKRNTTGKLEDNTVKCGTLVPANYFSYYRRNNLSNLWEYREEINLKNDTGYYMDVSEGESMTVNGKTMSPSNFINLVHSLHENKVLDLSNVKKVCGFGKQIIGGKRFARNKNNWTNFVTYIENTLKALNKDAFVFNSILAERSQSSDLNKFYIHKNFLLTITTNLPKDHMLSQFYSKYPIMTEKTKEHMNVLTQLNVSFIQTNTHTNLKNEVENQFNLIAAKYPMLKTLMVSSEYRKPEWCPSLQSEFVKEIVNYINFVDSTAKMV